MEQNNSALTGGCQCGAVRFRSERLGRPSICHCRMCQKAFGGFYGPLVTAYGVVWTRGQPKWFRSSNLAERGFCGECGTPLAYREVEKGAGGDTELAIGAFDHPASAAPEVQVNPADKLLFTDALHALPIIDPAHRSHERQAFYDGVTSFQHPDHDTAQWPLQPGHRP